MNVEEREGLIRRFTAIRADVLGYLRVVTRDPHLAEDLFQETSLVVLRKIDSFDPARDFAAWVRGIALNLARNAMRKGQHVHLMPSPQLAAVIEQAFAGDSTGESDERAARMEYLGHCLDQVDPRQRKLVELRYRGGASLEQIAARTGRTAGAVQVALTRIRQFLQKCMEQKRGLLSHG